MREVEQGEVRGWLATVDYDRDTGEATFSGGRIDLFNKDKVKGHSCLAKFDPSQDGVYLAGANFISNDTNYTNVSLPPSRHKLIGFIEEDMEFDHRTSRLDQINRFFDPGRMGCVYFFREQNPRKVITISRFDPQLLTSTPEDILDLDMRYRSNSSPILSDSREILEKVKATFKSEGIECYEMERLDII